MFICLQTCQINSCNRSTVKAVNFLLQNGCIFILAERFCQDPWKNNLVFKGNWWEEMATLIWRNLVTMIIQLESREMYLTFRNMQGKYNKRNSCIEFSNKTVPKPKIRKWIKWFQKHSHSFISSPIPERGLGGVGREGETLKTWVTG